MSQEPAIFEQFNDKEEELFSEIFREYERRLFIFVVRTLRSEQLAQDIVQEVFLKLWSIREKVAGIQNLNAYLYKLAENQVYDYLRHAAVEKRARQELWQRMQETTRDHSHTMIDREYNAIIEKAILRLPEQRRRVYQLSKREGKKQAQIAEELQISPHTVRNHLSEAFKQIGLYVRQNMTSWIFF
ncbi:RNA polymerase sigma-70 factor, ECF subfamily [Arachidicoccus rhizosphaerae]|uniref:RNA polymerase sigma-70 factor, ECF subfamily n=1 Tax=Arachidicoccus rhizosphaerae TaxID=551991 RepID=A0A1H3VUN4_9BACT|nr:RNA polymerase sigma-70 factor [Arachidicoccus rhizosphaerae]SDZ77798.1 RNA polymerase sigma-70 factor, ECF subfamily [Arachidicoccus rhizosphaerae]